MRKIIATTQLSLDGVMQAPGGPEEDTSNGFTQGGWFMHYGDDTLAQVLRATIAGPFDLLLGRRTYDIWAAYWPNHDESPIGQAFNRATKYVVTHRPKDLPWARSEPLGGDIVAGIKKLKQSPGPEFHVWGSSVLLQQLIAADLIDEHRLWIAPVVLGAGKRLFEPGVPPRTLQLVQSLTTSTGMIINTYRPGGNLKAET